MKKKIIKNFAILFICILIFPLIGNKLIIKNKFSLKSKNLKGLEELTSKVFTFTNHNDNQKMNHLRLINGSDLLPYTSLDKKLTEYYFFIYQTAMNYFRLDGYLCGGHSRYLQRLFAEHGIKSFTYNHGIDGTRHTHVIVVAEYRDNLYIFDPTYNYVYHHNDKYLTFEEVINLVKHKKSLEKFIKIINSQDKIFYLAQKKYENFTPSDIIEGLYINKHLIGKNKEHLLLNGFDFYAGNVSMEYFFEKYPYLKSLSL